jgi:hypothetical protein
MLKFWMCYRSETLKAPFRKRANKRNEDDRFYIYICDIGTESSYLWEEGNLAALYWIQCAKCWRGHSFSPSRHRDFTNRNRISFGFFIYVRTFYVKLQIEIFDYSF